MRTIGLSVKLSLQKNPDDIETPRRLLGHRSVSATLRAYSEMQSAAARLFCSDLEDLGLLGKDRYRGFGLYL
jgi:hypothetical protein